MIIKKLSILFLFLLAFRAFGQTVILHEKISDYDFKMPKEGPNFRHFTHLYLGYSFFIPSGLDTEIDVKNGTSGVFNLGWRYKLKVTNWFALGAGINYFNETYNLKQSENKIIPDSVQHKTEKLKFNNFGPDFYFRFNLGKRGNIIGRFVDLGAYCSWTVKAKHSFEDKVDPATSKSNASMEKVVYSNINYVEKFQYGLKARIGANRFVITGTYRLSDLFTEEYLDEKGQFTLPNLTVGLEIGLHQ
ncbi:MAG: hypothetical protein U0W24_23100 [Bacteroidales bacterium]